MGKKIVIAGASGLVGKALVNKAIKDNFFSEVITLVRYIGIEPKSLVKEHRIDFDTVKSIPKGDILVICLGTTRKKAGSKEGFRKVDYGYVIHLARLAESHGYENVTVVSSYGADSKSKNFYLRVKGQMEEVIQTINIASKNIIRPSLLLGKRNEFRIMESIAAAILKAISPFLKGKMQKHRPVYDQQVADAILTVVKDNAEGVTIIEPEWIHKNT